MCYIRIEIERHLTWTRKSLVLFILLKLRSQLKLYFDCFNRFCSKPPPLLKSNPQSTKPLHCICRHPKAQLFPYLLFRRSIPDSKSFLFRVARVPSPPQIISVTYGRKKPGPGLLIYRPTPDPGEKIFCGRKERAESSIATGSFVLHGWSTAAEM